MAGPPLQRATTALIMKDPRPTSMTIALLVVLAGSLGLMVFIVKRLERA
jgi:hypothetical protein